MDSIWSKTVTIEEREPLAGDMEAEVVVIGAGMAGLLTAYYLQKCKKGVVVLEATRIGAGQTKNTTAKITSQHGAIYASLIEKYGEKKAELYARVNEAAVDAYEKIIRENEISCHFERVDSYLYSTMETEKLEQELVAAKVLGIPAQYAERTELPFKVKGAVCFPNQAQFHPLEFVQQLSKLLTVYENTRVLRVKRNCVVTDRGIVRAKYIVFATHYPFPIVPGFYFARMHQTRSYVLALSGIRKWQGMYYSMDADGLSFRWYEDILLVGGGGHRTGEKIEEVPEDMPAGVYMPPKCGYSLLRERVRTIFPGSEEVACWSAQDCMSHDDLPLIGRFSCLRRDWYVATGFKKWGMTGAMISAQLISDLICGKDNPYVELFTPQRIHFRAAWKNLWQDIKISVVGLKNGHFRKATIKCPHMGCELEWNPGEQTWDCPCHGSRFSGDGSLIDNPAQKGLGEK